MTTISVPRKLCKTCGEWKPATTEYFSRDKGKKDGLSATCKECAKARSTKWYSDNHDYALERERQKYRDNPEPVKQRASQWAKDNPEQYKARLKKWGDENREYKREQDRLYAATHREETRQKAKDWYYDNPEQAKAQRDKWYQENKAKAHAQASEWAKAHPEYRKAASTRRRARKLAADGKYTVSDLMTIYDDQCGSCGYCGIRLHGKYDVDHYLPLTRGGSNYPENLILACASCNRSKGDKMFEEWMQHRDW